MRINTKMRYGLRTMFEIACNNDSGGVLQKDIAEKQNISRKYLDPIIAALKVKGLIVNVGGKHSGYQLAKSPKEITVKDIYTAFEPITIIDCLYNKNFCDKTCDCTARDYWEEFKEQFEEILSSKTLDQIICNKA